MKTRIISGIIVIAVVAGVIALGMTVSPYFITAFIAAAVAVAVYELLHNAAGIKSKLCLIWSMMYTVLMTALLDKNLGDVAVKFLAGAKMQNGILADAAIWWSRLPYFLTVLYFVIAVVLILKKHKEFSLAKIMSFCAFPIFLSYAFSTLSSVINGQHGIYYLLLLLNFSSVCDTGAYFVGVTLGKHKLCPEISPKKTVEGAIGGILSSVIVGIILVLLFGFKERLLAVALLTVPLCIVGMMGDLFASAIKRSVNLKDYGNLIPGHGGVLDRMDSILLIAPALYIFVELGVI